MDFYSFNWKRFYFAELISSPLFELLSGKEPFSYIPTSLVRRTVPIFLLVQFQTKSTESSEQREGSTTVGGLLCPDLQIATDWRRFGKNSDRMRPGPDTRSKKRGRSNSGRSFPSSGFSNHKILLFGSRPEFFFLRFSKHGRCRRSLTTTTTTTTFATSLLELLFLPLRRKHNAGQNSSCWVTSLFFRFLQQQRNWSRLIFLSESRP